MAESDEKKVYAKKVEKMSRELESNYNHRIPDGEIIYMRFDGKNFNKLLSAQFFRKPYDPAVFEIMEEVSLLLLQSCEFKIDHVYTQSDEISVVMFPKYDKKGSLCGLPFGGRSQKFISTISSFITHHFTCLLLDKFQANKAVVDHVKKRGIMFDGRICTGPETLGMFFWRRMDCVRNAKMMYAQHYCSHQELHKLSCEKAVELAEHRLGPGADKFFEASEHFREGILIGKNKMGNNWDDLFNNYKIFEAKNQTTNQTTNQTKNILGNEWEIVKKLLDN